LAVAVLAAIVPLPTARLFAQEPASPPAPKPQVELDDGSALKDLKRIKLEEGFAVELFASEPLCANLVALAFDEQGRCYVVETFRRDKQVLDMRDHRDWLEDDLACRTVEDRVAMIRKHAGKEVDLYRKESERLSLLVDRDGDGRADARADLRAASKSDVDPLFPPEFRSCVFAEGFDGLADGIAAGILARRGDVFLADMPNLWRLRDTRGVGRADQREILSTGYGVHFNFVGHDLHGLRIGPDGRLYFSLGDRGLHVVTQEGNLLDLPDAGAVLRCELDGSRLELIHTGLRNPQCLAFDDDGDLFTVDNNSDSGDKARLVHLVEGGDSGWCIGWQWIESPVARGPWNTEKMWHPRNDEQPASIVPPVDNLVSGPSGLAHYPGTGFSDPKFADSFFICDFEAEQDNTRVVNFTVKQAGASFALASQSDFVKRGIVATDCQFAPDGALYVTDWVHGWAQPRRGRVWRVFDPRARGGELARETQRLIGEGMTGRSTQELLARLQHRDQRIRQEAQFALAERGDDGLAAFTAVLDRAASRRARLHAIWGLGQLARNDRGVAQEAGRALIRALAQDDGEIRAQAAKVLGDAAFAPARHELVLHLSDPAPRVRFFAAQALVHMRVDAGATPERAELRAALVAALAAHGDDPCERLECVRALALHGDPLTFETLSGHENANVRLGVLLAMRQLGLPAIARFLDDSEPRIVREAARAIHDVPIPGALEALSKLVERQNLVDPVVLLRAIGANFRLGTAEHAARLGSTIARTDLPEGVRADALRALKEFDAPPARDRMLGRWRPCAPGRAPAAVAVTKLRLDPWLADKSDLVCEEAARFIECFKSAGHGETLSRVVSNVERGDRARIAALEALTALNDDRLRASIERAIADDHPRLRGAGRRALAKIDPDLALEILSKVLVSGSAVEKQDAFTTLGEMADARAVAMLARSLDDLNGGRLAPEAALDLLCAAQQKRDDAQLAPRLAQFEAGRAKDDPLSSWSECLVGGDAEHGRRLFFNRTELQCVKCHKVGNEGAGEAGPDLAGIGGRQTRRYLLESIALPNAETATGFQNTILFLKSGNLVEGRITGEDQTNYSLFTLDEGTLLVRKSEVTEKRAGQSAMLPDLIQKMSKPELRDLVEYLASLKQP
jgi:quinoprotein glucose dehydrogenase